MDRWEGCSGKGRQEFKSQKKPQILNLPGLLALPIAHGLGGPPVVEAGGGGDEGGHERAKAEGSRSPIPSRLQQTFNLQNSSCVWWERAGVKDVRVLAPA